MSKWVLALLLANAFVFLFLSGDTAWYEWYFSSKIDLTHTSVLITGGSSGIGRGLALAYARPGCHISITGLDSKRLGSTVLELEALGATVSSKILDVTNAAEMKAFIEEVDNKYPLTLVVANAGIGDGGRKDIETAYEVMNVNVVGLMNTLRPVIEPMKARGKGQIAIVSSVASFFEMKGDGAYIGSKTAVRIFGQTLRSLVAPNNIYVSVICPGWVHSRIQPDPGPLVLEANVSAKV